MNATAAQSQRLAISPYARRLARERGLSLETLCGTGPGGRILAADVLSFTAPPLIETQPVASAAVPAVAPRLAAFATSIPLGAMHALLTAFEASGRQFEIDDILLRAIGCAFDKTRDITSIDGAPVSLELDGRQVIFSAVGQTPAASLRAGRLEAFSHARATTRRNRRHSRCDCCA